MKKTRFLWAAALVIALVAMLAACPADEGLSLPGKAGDLGKVKAFDLTPPASENEALRLLSDGLDSLSTLRTLNSQAFANAFQRQENMAYFSWQMTLIGQTSASKSVKFQEKDSTFSGTYTDYNGIEIIGSSSGKMSQNKPFSLSTTVWAEGDKSSYSTSISKSVDFSNVKVPSAGGAGVYGFLKVEGKGSQTQTLKKLNVGTTEAQKWDTSSSSTEKVSAVLSISDGANSAKFKLSYATETSNKSKQANSSGGQIISDIEVFKNDGSPLFTIKDLGRDDYYITYYLSYLPSYFYDFSIGSSSY